MNTDKKDDDNGNYLKKVIKRKKKGEKEKRISNMNVLIKDDKAKRKKQ